MPSSEPPTHFSEEDQRKADEAWEWEQEVIHFRELYERRPPGKRLRFYCPNCGQVRVTFARTRPDVYVPAQDGYDHVHYPGGRRTDCPGGVLTDDSWTAP